MRLVSMFGKPLVLMAVFGLSLAAVGCGGSASTDSTDTSGGDTELGEAGSTTGGGAEEPSE